jgi:cell division protein FtsB
MTIDSSAIPLFMLTITLVVHLIATVWWAASLTKRVDHIEKWINSNERTSERIAALEQQIKDMGCGISRIEKYLRPKG